ncbi:mitochondrial 2-oxodicarboxylate carrier-like [Coccinella septempunctata]|uniref:mitochondrial 2-oxodicarboxylate carrier-like n=1 Tax=Coccinella septempunctata TaxID=41139 RepID=UPI001D0702AC|nr:mitochondrial 2-oxodicarboxylate carrier-like [Coccinella septempunctata]
MTSDGGRSKERLISLFSGASAGFVEVCIMHPLDLVKTRLQLQSASKSSTKSEYYTGITDCMRKMYKNEGILSFWKGILPPIVVDTPRRAIKFFTFDEYKRMFMFGQAKANALTYSLAGACAGATESILVNPFEVVKIHLQANRAKIKEVPSSFSVAKEIYEKDGLGSKGLYKGLTATIMRGAVFNVAYFGLYHSVRDFSSTHNRNLGVAEKIGLGFAAGTLASVANIPFDVAKSRIQGPQPQLGKVKYKSCIKTILLVHKEEGWRALYKGLIPKVLRLGPGGAIMFLVNEYVAKFLMEYFK